MKFALEVWRNLGADKDKIQDFYRSEEPEIILAVLIDPVQAGLTEEGHRMLKDLVEDSICLEQHIAFAGWTTLEDEENIDLRTAEVYRNLTYQGFLYDERGRNRVEIGAPAMRKIEEGKQ